MRDIEVRIVKDGQVVARVKIDYAKDKEVVKQIIAELIGGCGRLGDIEVWHNGMFVGLISSN